MLVELGGDFPSAILVKRARKCDLEADRQEVEKKRPSAKEQRRVKREGREGRKGNKEAEKAFDRVLLAL